MARRESQKIEVTRVFAGQMEQGGGLSTAGDGADDIPRDCWTSSSYLYIISDSLVFFLFRTRCYLSHFTDARRKGCPVVISSRERVFITLVSLSLVVFLRLYYIGIPALFLRDIRYAVFFQRIRGEEASIPSLALLLLTRVRWDCDIFVLARSL